MKREIYTLVLFYVILKVDCQYAQSPCPGIFSYQSDGNSVFGYITLKSSGRSVSSVHLRANFTIAAQLPTTYIGQIEVIGNDQLLQKFNLGVPLQYRVHFPVTSPIPRLTSIVVNGNSLCFGPGDLPAPHQYVTTISLEHMLYTKVGSNPQIFNPYENSGSDLDFVGNDGENTQIFTINDIGNRDGSWSSIFPVEPFLAMNNTRPVYGKPVPLPVYDKPVSRPVYDRPIVKPNQPRPNRPQPEYTQPNPDYNAYHPEPTTQATLPPPRPPRPTAPAIPSTPPRSPVAAVPVECGVIAGGNEQVPLIFNGNSYTRGEWPWLVAIYRRQEGSLTFICAGTLVSDRHIITAAHCKHYKDRNYRIKDMVVKVGVYNLEDWGDDISVTRTLQSAQIHESYNSSTLENDIMLFTMERTVEFNNFMRPACLWNGNTDLSRIVGASGTVAGWGQSEVGPVGKGEPRMVTIPIVSTSTCRASKPEFHQLTSSNTLCAGDRKGSGPCLGDSGGGLYILDNGRWRLRGVVSVSIRPTNGENSCNLNEYIVFTDTAQFLSWIKNIMSKQLFDF